MIALLVESASRSFVLGGIVGLALFGLRVRNPHLQKTVWVVVLLACLAMPFALEWRVAPSFNAPTQLVTLTSVASDGSGPQSAFTGSRLITSSLTLGYSVVALALLARFAAGLAGVSRIRRFASPASTLLAPATCGDIRISAQVKSPSTFGSTILLPESAIEWSKEKLLAVLTHEQSHVRHRDSYVQWLACVHTCLFWFNPFAWWLNRRLADLAETTSDDAVLHAMPDRAAYASLLLDVARQPAGAPAAATSVVTSAARSNVSARIERIISNTPPARPLRRRMRALAIVALMPLLAMAAATLRPASPSTVLPHPSAAGDRGPMEPTTKILSYGSLQELHKFYPEDAMRAGVETVVGVRLTIDAGGTVSAAEAIDPSPADTEWGFPDAAVAVAKTVKFQNSVGTPQQTTLKVKFALK